jgi:hypothetical protein
MGKRAFGIFLGFLPYIILLLSVFIALNESDFDTERALLGNAGQIIDRISNFYTIDFSGDSFKITGIDITQESVKIILEINSPFDFPVIIKDMSAELSDGSTSVKVELLEEVKLRPGESKTVELVGSGLEEGFSFRSDVSVQNFRIVLEMLGITLDVKS